MIKRFVLALLAAALSAQQQGTLRLTNGWQVRPEGRQIALKDTPVDSVLTSDKKYLIVLNRASVVTMNAITGVTIDTLPIPSAGFGLSISRNGKLLYIAGGTCKCVIEATLDPTGRLVLGRTFPIPDAEFTGAVVPGPEDRLLYATDFYKDQIVVINTQSGRVISRFPTGKRPYQILFHPSAETYYVTSWADGTLYQYDTKDGGARGFIRLGPHATAMLWRERKTTNETARIFVTASNTNSVFSVGVNDAKDMRLLERINIATGPRQPLGMTPTALALSEDKDKLYVVSSDDNVVSVANIAEEKTTVDGLIPTGWYPVAITALPQNRIAVFNSRGDGKTATVSWIVSPRESALRFLTQHSLENSAFRDEQIDAKKPANIPAIEHIVYLLNEGGTYDETLSAPNQAQLAKEFTRFENFYTIGETVAERYEWATAAISPFYLQRISTPKKSDPQDRASLPPAGYIWSQTPMPALDKLPEMDFPKVSLMRTANDQSLGRTIDALTHSKFWPKMAIFVLTINAEKGSDHIHKNRVPAFLISPYVKRNFADTTFYNSTSMLRTIELLLGLRPMTQFDAAANPIWQPFQSNADLKPFNLVK